jgi:hypothetical protein
MIAPGPVDGGPVDDGDRDSDGPWHDRPRTAG